MALGGCVTTDDLSYVRRSLSEQIATVQGNVARLQESLEAHDGMIAENRKALAQDEDLRKTLRKNQADVGADIINLRDEVQRLRGAVEELSVEITALKSSTLEGTASQRAGSLGDLETRMRTVEDRLKISPGAARGVPPKKKQTPAPASAEKPDSEQLYSDAYKVFVEHEYGSAKTKFQEFLKLFPDTEYSDNAQFWIAECFYFQDKYEEAILEYEKVIQNYPKGNKVPNALLKQALSFLKLGDKASSRLLLQRVMKDFPGTTPAETARSKLLEIK